MRPTLDRLRRGPVPAAAYSRFGRVPLVVSGEQSVPHPSSDGDDIEVFIESGWWPGERRQVKVLDGVEVHTVRYVDDHGQTRVDDFPAGLVRPIQTRTEPPEPGPGPGPLE